MSPTQSRQAAELLLNAWRAERRIEALPEACRPATRAEGYAIQEQVADLSQQATFGWKIAATSVAGQKHIGVDGPLAGRLLSARIHSNGATIPLGNTAMHVAEAEFAFRLGGDLPPRPTQYSQEEVMAAVDTLHPAIELPDSRYEVFTRAGAAQLIADNACAHYFVLGAAAPPIWRGIDLRDHAVKGYIDSQLVQEGSGANVLGDPRIAMTWIANELSSFGIGLRAGQVITTGTAVVPLAIKVGSRVHAAFGSLGSVDIALC